MKIKSDDLTKQKIIVLNNEDLYILSGSYASIAKGLDYKYFLGFIERGEIESLSEIAREIDVSTRTVHKKANELADIGAVKKIRIDSGSNIESKHRYKLKGRRVGSPPYVELHYFFLASWSIALLDILEIAPLGISWVFYVYLAVCTSLNFFLKRNWENLK